jgi:proteasome lid subunit RPN8/RPN11
MKNAKNISPMRIRRCELEKAVRHAQEGYPLEVVGLLSGDRASKSVTRVSELSNECIERRHERYLVSGLKILEAERELGKEGLQTVGYYHSHPDHPARFSEMDLANAHLDMSYLILSLHAGELVDVLSWRLAENQTEMQAESVEIEEE